MIDNPDAICRILLFHPLHQPTATAKPYICKKPFKKIFRFKIVLQDVVPSVWRRIEVPDCYTFWDLHVAITDAFGWLDNHLHEFEMANPKTGKSVRFGSPDDEGFDQLDDAPPAKSDREKKISGLFTIKNTRAIYRYDFGDGWEHSVELEDILSKEEKAAYPRCTAGEMAGPPDDCGGPPGYQDLREVLGDPDHEERADRVRWLEGMKGKDWKPDFFDPAAVHFDNPDKRWKIAYEDEEITPGMRGWDFFKRQGG